MQRSNLVDKIQILVPRYYKDLDLLDSTVILEYILPISKKYKTKTLTLSDNNYKNSDILQYVIDSDTSITSEFGDIEFQVSFIKLEMDINGKIKQCVRKTQKHKITITPISAWSDIIPDDALTSLDQRIINLEGIAKQLDVLTQENYNNSVDNIVLDKENKEIYLTSHNNKKGDSIYMRDISQIVKENIIGKDLDGVEDGIVYLDDINNN